MPGLSGHAFLSRLYLAKMEQPSCVLRCLHVLLYRRLCRFHHAIGVQETVTITTAKSKLAKVCLQACIPIDVYTLRASVFLA